MTTRTITPAVSNISLADALGRGAAGFVWGFSAFSHRTRHGDVTVKRVLLVLALMFTGCGLLPQPQPYRPLFVPLKHSGGGCPSGAHCSGQTPARLRDRLVSSRPGGSGGVPIGWGPGR
jgi:hypothetical protein